MNQTPRTNIAIISNEPTPYRLAVLNRIADELSEATTYNIFTHTVSKPHMPWAVAPHPKIKPLFFDRHALGASNPLRCYGLYRDIKRFVIDKQISLIVLLGYNDLARLLLIGWAKRAGIPLLVTGDSNVFGEGRVGAIRKFVKRRVVRHVLKRAAGLMPMGTCGRAFYRSYMDHNLPTFLFPYEPNYAAMEQCDASRKQAFMAKHKLDADRKRLLYCGRLIEIKRVDDLLAAFCEVADERPEWDLVIAGDGELRERLQASVPDALRDRVKWTGFLQFDDTVACYHACDVLVLPSAFEPWGVVINEAVCCGLAVIATEVVGAAVELVKHGVNGMIVPPRDVAALRHAIGEVTDPQVCQWMQTAAKDQLRHWRRSGDPVDGLRQAMRYFKTR
jgi:glycosyltransferase involved in cell wall biosynthesis